LNEWIFATGTKPEFAPLLIDIVENGVQIGLDAIINAREVKEKISIMTACLE
jgi:hypothetical protein